MRDQKRVLEKDEWFPVRAVMKSVTVAFYSNITLLLNLTQRQISETDNFNYVGPGESNRWLFINTPSDFHELRRSLQKWTWAPLGGAHRWAVGYDVSVGDG